MNALTFKVIGDIDNKYIQLSNSLVILKMCEKLNAMQLNVGTAVQGGQGLGSAQVLIHLKYSANKNHTSCLAAP